MVLRLPLIGDPVDVKPDGCEYLGIARHLAREGRWVSSIKWHFFTDEPPRHAALADRPPLFPLLAAAVWRMADGGTDRQRTTNDEARTATDDLDASRFTPILAVRWVNAMLAGLGTVLAYLWLETLFPRSVALGASFVLAIYPAWMRDSAQPLTEPLFMALWLSAFLVYYRRPLPRLTPMRAIVLGALSGLAYLTRPTGLLLPTFFSLVAWRGWSGVPRRALLVCLAALWLSFVAVWLPYGIAVAREYGSPFTSILSYNFSIRHIYEGTLYGFERRFPRPWEFVASQPGQVVGLIAHQTWVLALALGRSLRFLLPLALLMPPDVLRRRADLLLFAALNFLFYALSWIVWGAGRYLLPTYLLLVAVLLEGAVVRAATGQKRGGVWRALPAVLALSCLLGAIGASLSGDARLYREKGRPDAGVPLGWAYRKAANRIRAEGARGVCASNQPWILNLLTEQPTRIAPRFRDAAQAVRYLDRYRPGYLAYLADEPKDQQVVEILAPIAGSRRQVAPELRSRVRLLEFEERLPNPGANGGRVPVPKAWVAARSAAVGGDRRPYPRSSSRERRSAETTMVLLVRQE